MSIYKQLFVPFKSSFILFFFSKNIPNPQETTHDISSNIILILCILSSESFLVYWNFSPKVFRKHWGDKLGQVGGVFQVPRIECSDGPIQVSLVEGKGRLSFKLGHFMGLVRLYLGLEGKADLDIWKSNKITGLTNEYFVYLNYHCVIDQRKNKTCGTLVFLHNNHVCFQLSNS